MKGQLAGKASQLLYNSLIYLVCFFILIFAKIAKIRRINPTDSILLKTGYHIRLRLLCRPVFEIVSQLLYSSQKKCARTSRVPSSKVTAKALRKVPNKARPRERRRSQSHCCLWAYPLIRSRLPRGCLLNRLRP